jgi:phage I-like protein
METKRFDLPADGFVQLMPYGEYPHKGAGVTQVLDEIAGREIVKHFDALKNKDGFPGVQIDFDHYSDLSEDEKAKLSAIGILLPSDAAGWMQDIQARGDGLYVKADWTPSGKERLENGEYRFLSPNFPIASLESLGGGKVRPHAISKAGLTNEPNLVGIAAITNRSGGAGLIGPACQIENRATINTEMKMDYKGALCEMLGIPADSDDAAIENACGGMRTQKEQLANSAREAQAEADIADLEKEGAVIANRADVKGSLIANREATLKAIRALKVVSLPNRADAVPPVVVTPADRLAMQNKAINEAYLKNRCTSNAQAYHFAAKENPTLFA